MTYCLNPNCRKPQNPERTKFCQNCGAQLLLKDRYRALELIGQGGFGKTFLAIDEHKPSKPRCVIKQFFPQAQGTHDVQKAETLFEQEAVRLDELGQHPQIPALMAHFTQDSRQYLVQEFIDGLNLAQVLKTTGPFNEALIRNLLSSLLPVLEFIHSRNVIHRDIKPDNIIISHQSPEEKNNFSLPNFPSLTPGGGPEFYATPPNFSGVPRNVSYGVPSPISHPRELFLVDFGAAKYATGAALLKTGTTIGTPEYIAPEQARGKAVFASDLYSLGVTCLYLLTQISPFELFDVGEDAWGWRQHLKDNPVSPQLGQILDKLIQNATNRRYQSASDVLTDLQQYQPVQFSFIPENPPLNLNQSPAITPIKTPAFPGVPSQHWKCINTLAGHTQWVRSIAFSANGEILASGSEDHTIKLWQVATGQEICTLRGHSASVNAIVLSPDGELLISGSEDKNIKIWHIHSGRQIRTLGDWSLGEYNGHSDAVNSLVMSRDGKLLISGSKDHTLKIWQLGSRDANPHYGQMMATLTGHSRPVRSVTLSVDGTIIASGSEDNTIKLWQVNTQKEVSTLGSWFSGFLKFVNSVAFHPNGQILASGSWEKNIKVWQISTGQILLTLEGHLDYVRAVVFSPDGKILASSSDDKTIKIWHPDTGQELGTLTGHSNLVTTIVFSPDGKMIASGSGDNTIKFWQQFD